MLKHNLVGIWVAFTIYLLLSHAASRRWRPLFHALGAIVLGTAIAILPAFFYFAFNRALPQLWDAVFRFTLIDASRSSLMTRARFLSGGQKNLSTTGIWLLSVTAWIAGAYHIYHVRIRLAARDRFLLVVLIAFPIELLLTAASGGGYAHYFIAWLPTMAMLTGYLFYLMIEPSGHGLATGRAGRASVHTRLWLPALLVAATLLPVAKLSQKPAPECISNRYKKPDVHRGYNLHHR